MKIIELFGQKVEVPDDFSEEKAGKMFGSWVKQQDLQKIRDKATQNAMAFSFRSLPCPSSLTPLSSTRQPLVRTRTSLISSLSFLFPSPLLT